MPPKYPTLVEGVELTWTEVQEVEDMFAKTQEYVNVPSKPTDEILQAMIKAADDDMRHVNKGFVESLYLAALEAAIETR